MGTSERRQYRRRNDHFRVDMRPFRVGSGFIPKVMRDGAVLVGHSRDLSVSGMALVVKDALPLGFLLSAEIHVPELDQPISIVVEVVRCQVLPGKGYDLGLRNVPQWIGESERAALIGLLYDS